MGDKDKKKVKEKDRSKSKEKGKDNKKDKESRDDKKKRKDKKSKEPKEDGDKKSKEKRSKKKSGSDESDGSNSSNKGEGKSSKSRKKERSENSAGKEATGALQSESKQEQQQQSQAQGQHRQQTYDPNSIAYDNWKKSNSAFSEFERPGPHYADSQMMELFRDRMTELQYLINTQLISKRQEVLNQIFTVQHKVDELENVKLNIVRETQDHVDQILGRLDLQEQEKLKPLKDYHQRLQKHLDDIQRFIDRMSHALPYIRSSLSANVAEMKEIPDSAGDTQQEETRLPPKVQRQYPHENNTSSGPAPSLIGSAPYLDVQDFVRNYPEFVNECHLLAQRPITTPTDVRYDDLPREMYKLVKLEQKCEHLEHEAEVKDSLIKTLTKERDAIRKQRDVEVKQLTKLYKSTKDELRNWIELSSSKIEGAYKYAGA